MTLLNVMEERDVQVRGYRVRLELDLFVIASANPEDYTSRGRIIIPLKDRFGAQIRTHLLRSSSIPPISSTISPTWCRQLPTRRRFFEPGGVGVAAGKGR